MKPRWKAEVDAHDPRRRSAAGVGRGRSDPLLVPSTSQWEGRVDDPVAATVIARLVLRALRTLPARHGEVRLRADSGFYSVGFLNWCRQHHLRFCVVVPHYQIMWELRRHISPRSVGQ